MGLNHSERQTSSMLLSEIYNESRARNPRYSLRAFARKINIPVSSLSEILANKREITPKMAEKISTALKMSKSKQDSFLKSVHKNHIRKLANLEAKKLDSYASGLKELNPHLLEEDNYKLIAEWIHFAILSLIETKDFKFKPAWIAKRFGVSTSTVRDALLRLLRLGLVEEAEGTLILKQEGCAATTKKSCEALQHFYKENMSQAIHAMETIPVELREFSSITLAIDPDKMEFAKALILRFRRFAAKLLESDKGTEVYNMNIQLFPITKLRNV